MKNPLASVGFFFVILLILSAVSVGDNPIQSFVAALVYQETITPEIMTARYVEQRFRIAIVPGHDNEYSGAQYRGVREADVNLEIARELHELLAANPKFIVYQTRDYQSGDYTKEIKEYLREKESEILENHEQKKREFETYVEMGDLFLVEPPVHHNFARSEVAFRLKGINAWANEREIDLTLHLHVNDAPGRRYDQPGKYSGFSIYIPEGQFPNSRASRKLAETLFSELSQFLPVSNLPGERGGIVEDQELIAIGPYATSDGASVLLEYGYIHEAPFWKPALRQKMAEELALRTYRGLLSYFETDLSTLPQTTLLPYDFVQDLDFQAEGPAVLALQKALLLEGLYPPRGEDLSECPLSGVYRTCVRAAVADFQERYKLPPVGKVGPQTREKLNERYSPAI